MGRSVELEVLNSLGLHARPATEFVKCALRFPATTIRIDKDGATFAATSILEVLTANLDQGATFTLEVDGPDADAAIAELSAMLERFRDEEEAEAK